MIEAVRTAVSLLEYHMTILMQYPRFATKAVNQEKVYNAIYDLKTKCGIKFDGEFMNRIEMDRRHLVEKHDPKIDTDFEELMQRQHQEREARTQRVMARLKARPSKT